MPTRRTSTIGPVAADILAQESKLDALIRRSVEKLNMQRHLADQANQILCRQDLNGLNQNTAQTLKNLQAAITVARRPGYFTYWQPSVEVKKVEETKLLAQFTAKIRALQTEIDQLNAEIEAIRSLKHDKPPLELKSFTQWLQVYGAPSGYDTTTRHFDSKSSPPTGYMSQLTPSAKVYGSSAHHPAFRTQAVTLKKGRITR